MQFHSFMARMRHCLFNVPQVPVILFATIVVFVFTYLTTSASPLSTAKFVNSAPGRPVCGTLVNVSGNIVGNTVWTSDYLYVLTNDVTINNGVSLTIEPGVVIKAQTNASMYVEGKLTADGTPDNPIYMTSWKDDELCGDTNGDGNATTPVAGDWGRIEFRSNSDLDSRIQRAIIQYSGKDYYYGNEYTQAIRLNNVSPTLSNITFASNIVNAAGLVGGTWTTNTLSSTTVIYHSWNDITVANDHVLTIEPNVKLKFGNDVSLYVQGRLTADGEENSVITFTSEKDDEVCGQGANGESICDTNNDTNISSPAVKDWGRIEFEASSDNTSSIERAVVRYSGQDYYYGNYDVQAIRIINRVPTLENITFEFNYVNAVGMVGGTWTTNTLASTTVVYHTWDDITVANDHELTINPGVKLKFGDDATLYIQGRLMANGVQSDPIVFTSVKDDTICGTGASEEVVCDTNNDLDASVPAIKDWGRIEFEANSDPNGSIQRAIIRYSGQDYYYGNYDVQAIRLVNRVPTLENITFEENLVNAAGLVGRNWTTNTLASTTVIYHSWDDILVEQDRVLSMLPGVKVKFDTDATVTVDGKFVAEGTAILPITFTSIKDDTVCGQGAINELICDTNNDNADSIPEVGNWGWINITQASTPGSSINYAKFLYGGRDYYYGVEYAGVLQIRGVNPDISNTLFSTNRRGIDLYNNAHPTFACNDFVDNAYEAVFNDTGNTLVVAEGQWWGSSSGPQHASNPNGEGELVSDRVDFVPWSASACVSNAPIPTNTPTTQPVPPTITPTPTTSYSQRLYLPLTQR